MSKKTALIAVAAAAMFAAGSIATVAQAQNGVKCTGANACKGQSACKTASSACKGMNACKGQGGCKSGDNGCAGKNSCKGHGGCAVPVKPAA